MLRFLFPRLTADANEGAAAFAAVVRQARDPAWYRACGVADTLDGRFGVLASLLAVLLVRLEDFGAEGDGLSARVTERFIAAMEAEHREIGLGDPTLGKTVRKLVGMLERRVDALRPAMRGDKSWDEAARDVLPGEEAAARLESFSTQLRGAPLDRLSRGDWR